MKKIGIILREFNATYENVELYGLTRELIKFLRAYDVDLIAIPVIFNNSEEFDRVKRVIDICDGVILPGGLDFYNEDVIIAKYCYEQDIPTLGICLGMQIIGKAIDGEVGILDTTFHDSREEYVHNVVIDKESLLYEILKKEEIKVNSRHHDYVIDTKLNISAKSDDGIIEAIEDKNKRFFIGVQWHPESLIEDENSRKIFEYFISKL